VVPYGLTSPTGCRDQRGTPVSLSLYNKNHVLVVVANRKVRLRVPRHADLTYNSIEQARARAGEIT